MKNNKHKKPVLIIFGFFIVITISIALLNTSAYPDEPVIGCHPEGYTISAEVSEINAEASSTYSLEVIGTGENVVIDVIAGAFDNNEFIISPGNIITDNSPDDLDSAANSIRVVLNITMPSQSGLYSLRILSRASLDGVDTGLAEFDIDVMVGIVTVSEAPLITLFFIHSNYYIGTSIVILLVIGLIIYLTNLKEKKETALPDKESGKESNLHGIFFTGAFTLATINTFLILTEAMNFAFGSIEIPIINYISLLSHIILGSIGYIAGIVTVLGTYTKVPILKMKYPVFIMCLTWTINFFLAILLQISGG